MADKTVRVGYLFKPTHSEIHYVSQVFTGTLQSDYDKNFTTNPAKAYTGTDKEKAKTLIADLVSKFKPDDEYVWTPVLIDAEQSTYQRCVSGVWLDEAIPLKLSPQQKEWNRIQVAKSLSK